MRRYLVSILSNFIAWLDKGDSKRMYAPRDTTGKLVALTPNEGVAAQTAVDMNPGNPTYTEYLLIAVAHYKVPTR